MSVRFGVLENGEKGFEALGLKTGIYEEPYQKK